MKQPKPIIHGGDHRPVGFYGPDDPGGADPIPWSFVDNNVPLADAILVEPNLIAFWKFNETAGDIAADSFASYDMDSGAYAPPTWAQPAGPPGDVTAGFANGLGESLTSFPIISGDLTAEIWAYRNDLEHGSLIGAGTPSASNTAGWSIEIGAFNEGAFNRPKVFIGDTTGGPHGFEADTALLADVWAHIAITRASNIWTLYLNSVAQSGTYDDSGTNFNSVSGIWAGNNPTDTGQTTNFNGNLSYAAVYDRALTAAEILEHYTGGVESGLLPDGYVWTLQDSIGAWLPPTIEVEF